MSCCRASSSECPRVEQGPSGVRYYFGGRVRPFTLGNVCVMGLAQARDEARRILARVAMGSDPQREKVEARKQREGALSFGDLGQRFMKENEARLRPNTCRQWTAS